MHFLVIFRYLQISFAVKSSGVDQALTKRSESYFNIFHILNQGRISKIEKKKYLMVQPPSKKGLFFGGGKVWSLKGKAFGVCLGPKIMDFYPENQVLPNPYPCKSRAI